MNTEENKWAVFCEPLPRMTPSFCSAQYDYFAEILWRGDRSSVVRMTKMLGQIDVGDIGVSNDNIIIFAERSAAYKAAQAVSNAVSARERAVTNAHEICRAAIAKIKSEHKRGAAE